MVADAIQVDEKALLSELQAVGRTNTIKNRDVARIVKKNT